MIRVESIPVRQTEAARKPETFEWLQMCANSRPLELLKRSQVRTKISHSLSVVLSIPVHVFRLASFRGESPTWS